MTDTIPVLTEPWTSLRANTLAVVCLFMGIAGGWLLRGWHSPAVTGAVKAANVLTPPAMGTTPAAQMRSPARLKEMADTQAAALLDQLRSDPKNPDLLTSIGNVYYDAQQYPIAVDYYGRALKGKPSDSAVRTDMATAYWYIGNADGAIAEFNKALTFQPDKPNTLFNLGLVKWKGKMDAAGAVADWEKLLATNPNYDGRAKVEQMLAEVKKDVRVKPRTMEK